MSTNPVPNPPKVSDTIAKIEAQLKEDETELSSEAQTLWAKLKADLASAGL